MIRLKIVLILVFLAVFVSACTGLDFSAFKQGVIVQVNPTTGNGIQNVTLNVTSDMLNDVYDLYLTSDGGRFAYKRFVLDDISDPIIGFEAGPTICSNWHQGLYNYDYSLSKTYHVSVESNSDLLIELRDDDGNQYSFRSPSYEISQNGASYLYLGDLFNDNSTGSFLFDNIDIPAENIEIIDRATSVKFEVPEQPDNLIIKLMEIVGDYTIKTEFLGSRGETVIYTKSASKPINGTFGITDGKLPSSYKISTSGRYRSIEP